jgi:acetyl esterase
MTTVALDPALAEFARVVHASVGTAPPRIPSAAAAPGQSPAQWLADVEDARSVGDGLAAIVIDHLDLPRPEVAAVLDQPIAVAGAAIHSRVYIPHGEGPFPAVVYFHGGGWWLAGGARGFALNDSHCRILCAGAETIVVTVDYRLAPEFPFPLQLEDAFDAVCWVQQGDHTLAIDRENVSVCGSSSGGNLAAAVCLLAREGGAPAIAAQILHVPALDLTLGSPSVLADPETASHLSAVIDLYVAPEQRSEPTVSPLLADDLGGLPPAFIATGRYDPLRDDGQRYAERLFADGTAVTWIDYPMFHGIGLPETMRTMYADIIGTLRAARG